MEEIIQSTLNILLLPLTLVLMCLILPFYWACKIASFLVRSLFLENVKGKVILITGASSGIGEHVAYEYAKRGARLALVARRRDRLLMVAEKARELGSPDTLVVCADISKHRSCEKLVGETIDHFGRVDHLVNNAGITSAKLLEEYSDIQEMKLVMDTNFWGTVHTTRFAMPHIRRSKGRIVVMSSAVYWIPFSRRCIYSGSKGALMSLFETLRVEVGRDVKITLVIPGFIESEMTTIRNNTHEAQTTNGLSIEATKKKLRFPIEKAEVCAKAIVNSVCRGDKYLIEPRWVLSIYYIKLLCPELLEFFQRRLTIEFWKKFM